jgi:2-(3-amino-3-carboxypropyl)histidine synthase
LEVESIIDLIKSNNHKKVLLQFPDGLKQYSDEVCDKIKEKTKSEIIIWAGSNFGGCDIPLEVEKLGFDLIVHFGHSKFE